MTDSVRGRRFAGRTLWKVALAAILAAVIVVVLLPRDGGSPELRSLLLSANELGPKWHVHSPSLSHYPMSIPRYETIKIKKQVRCANHWTSVGGRVMLTGGASWPAPYGELLPSKYSDFIEMLGHAPVTTLAEIRRRLDAHVFDCPGGIYQTADSLGTPFPHSGIGIMYPGPSLGFSDVVDSVVNSAPSGPSVYYCLFKNGVFASIIIFGTQSVTADEALVVKAEHRL